MEIYYTSMLSHPEILAGKHWDIPTYKASLKVISDHLMNSFVTFQDQERLFSYVGYSYVLWKKENPNMPEETAAFKNFINIFRKDLADRITYEISMRII